MTLFWFSVSTTHVQSSPLSDWTLKAKWLKVCFELGSSVIRAASNQCLSTYGLNQTQYCCRLLRGRKRLHVPLPQQSFCCFYGNIHQTEACCTVQMNEKACRHVPFITTSHRVQSLNKMKMGEINSLFWQINCSEECEFYSEII